MAQELKIGSRVYKEADFYKLNDEEFESIHKYIKERENNLIDNLLKGKGNKNSDVIEQLNLLNNVKSTLNKVSKGRMDAKMNEDCEKNKVNPKNKVDKNYNNTVDNLKEAYSSLIDSIDQQISKLQEKKDMLLKNLKEEVKDNGEKTINIDDVIKEYDKNAMSDYYNDLVNEQEEKDANAIIAEHDIDKLISEYEKKNFDIDTLNDYNSSLAKEGENNIKSVGHRYIDKSMVDNSNKKLFDRIKEFIGNKLKAKKLDKKVYKDKEDKLKGILDSIRKNIDNAKEKLQNTMKISSKKFKKVMAIALCTLSMAGIQSSCALADKPQEETTTTTNAVEDTEKKTTILPEPKIPEPKIDVNNEKKQEENKEEKQKKNKEEEKKENKEEEKKETKEQPKKSEKPKKDEDLKQDGISFEQAQGVATVQTEVMPDNTVKVETNVDQQKVDNLVDNERIIDEQTKEIMERLSKESNITEEQVKKVIKKFIEIEEKDLTDDEKGEELLEYINTNEDGITNRDVVAIITAYIEGTKAEEKANKEEEKSYSELIADILRTVDPNSNISNTDIKQISDTLGFPEKDILDSKVDEYVVNSSKTYLREENPDDPGTDFPINEDTVMGEDGNYYQKEEDPLDPGTDAPIEDTDIVDEDGKEWKEDTDVDDRGTDAPINEDADMGASITIDEDEYDNNIEELWKEDTDVDDIGTDTPVNEDTDMDVSITIDEDEYDNDIEKLWREDTDVDDRGTDDEYDR